MLPLGCERSLETSVEGGLLAESMAIDTLERRAEQSSGHATGRDACQTCSSGLKGKSSYLPSRGSEFES